MSVLSCHEAPKPDLANFTAMASAAAPPASYSLPLSAKSRGREQQLWIERTTRGRRRRRRGRGNGMISLRVFAAQEPAGKRQRAPPPGVDTRIHWDNEDEGWIGGGHSNSNSSSTQEPLKPEEDRQKNNPLGEKFSDLLNSSDSHYQFLGVSPDADLEEIKAAYRRLSKEYHPDTTSLPLKAASDKFMQLREIYDVLSDDEKRRFYDWTLAQEAASREAEKMRMKLEDPYMKDLENWESVPDMVDRLGGRNLELSDQAMTALTFDAVIIVFAICCIVYTIFFKEPYY
ncbi:NAD(P)H-quinone oxidoreductase subunit T, chloroplastic [Diospyros lotus]|uniref:NAD(P)H-quinone oxidoreductase subunit T, chloroplastic n=1 Tax=Diospyros lotus TaxID=55363 RepID=UPI00224EC728|nr:NAD(P)H-quinone oxidoreductase subunit T, chloroplastic [Diospyros lotus]